MKKFLLTTTLFVFMGLEWIAGAANIATENKELLIKEVIYGHKYGMALTFDVYMPEKSNGAGIIFINSGGFLSPIFRDKEGNLQGSEWLLLNLDPDVPGADLGLGFSFKDLLSEGYTLFDVSHSSTPKFTLDEIVEDCKQAVRYIRYNAEEFNIQQDKIGAWGMSAGGYLASFLGVVAEAGIMNGESLEQTSCKVNAVVAYFSTGYDFVEEIKKAPFLKEALPSIQIDDIRLDKLSIKHFISLDDAPTLIIYGDEDSPFISEPSQKMHSEFLAKKVPSKLIVFPGTGHLFRNKDGSFNDDYNKKALEELLKWFDGYLLKK